MRSAPLEWNLCGWCVAGSLIVMTVLAAGARADDATKQALQDLAGTSILFGHQSIGADALAGLAELARGANATLPIVELTPDGGKPVPGTLQHVFLPENGRPDLKLETFARLIDASGPYNIALMKFCFIDFDAGIDPSGLFERYQSTLRALQARHPDTVFIHVTVPLTTVDGWWKSIAKSALGRPVWGQANLARETFNDLMRSAYAGREPVFDLARVESTAQDGKRETASIYGRRIAALVPAYASDGAHLNSLGQATVAKAFLDALVAASRRPPSVATGEAEATAAP